MNRILPWALIAVAVSVAPAAYADHRHHHRHHHPYKVIQIYEHPHHIPDHVYYHKVPRYQACRVPYYGYPPKVAYRRHSALPIVVGGIIGGVLGHELGRGDAFVTATGTLAGGVIGHELYR